MTDANVNLLTANGLFSQGVFTIGAALPVQLRNLTMPENGLINGAPWRNIFQIGPTGPTGATVRVSGPTGPNQVGQTGTRGPTGPDGISIRGPTGTNGRGATGPTGARGNTGGFVIGPMGLLGPVGQTGPNGPAGSTGPIGGPGVTGTANRIILTLTPDSTGILSTPQNLSKSSTPQFSQLYIGTRTPKPSIPVAQSILIDGTISNPQWNSNTLLATDSTKTLKSVPLGGNLSIQNNTFNVSPYSVFSSINLNSGAIRYYYSASYDVTVMLNKGAGPLSKNTFGYTIVNNVCTLELRPTLFSPGTNTNPNIWKGIIEFNLPVNLSPINSYQKCSFPILVRSENKNILGNALFVPSTRVVYICTGGGLNGFPQQNTLAGWDKTIYLTYILQYNPPFA